MNAHAFEQQPNESAKAFAAFSVYLSLGAERSLAAVGKQLGKSEPLIKRWSARWRWTERVAAHAAHFAAVERAASEALSTTNSVDWAKRQDEHREEEWQVRCELVELGREAIRRWQEHEQKCGTLEGVSRLFELASKLGRLASGMATDKTELTGEDGGPIRLELEAALKKIYGQAEPAPPVADVAAPPASFVDVEAVEIGKAESGKQIAEIKSTPHPVPLPDRGGEGGTQEKK